MKRIAAVFLATVLFGCSQPAPEALPVQPPEAAAAPVEADRTQGEASFAFERIDPAHSRMAALMENAFAYVAPETGIIDAASGYPVEGWNQDPERGLFLRSFTQLTAIGQWIELLANVAAGYADNPHISRDEALERLALAVASLRHDQHDPKVSAKGLLGNFLGFEGETRIGPLARDVARADVVEAFGEEKAAAVWEALKEKEWIRPENQDQSGVILRDESYGLDYFDGPLEPFADDATRERLMEIMDERIVMVAYGDNANLASSVAKAIGALLRPEIRDRAEAVELRAEMERFLDDQQEGYEFLFDDKAGMLSFGWNASTDKYFGWEDLQGKWTVGHSDYLVNEFRGPTMFVLLRYCMPEAIVANLGFKIKSYRLQDGRLTHTLAPWEGSAFQALGLSLSMGEMDDPTWRRILQDVVDVEVDYAERHQMPGFLSESYSGDGTEYTGSIGIPEITVSPKPRITDAPSLYTLGVAYTVAPEKVERLLDARWEVISTLLTDHGPWEGYNTTAGEAIEFQTSAHMLSLILGGLGTASENMQRYLDSKDLGHALEKLYQPGEAVDFLAPDKQVVAWTPDGSRIESSRDDRGLHVQGDDVGEGAVTIVLPGDEGVHLSGGLLKIGYTAGHPVDKVVVKLDKKDPAAYASGVILSEIFTRFDVADGEPREIEIPLPATPGLAGIKELVLLCGSGEKRGPMDLSITRLQFVPTGRVVEEPK